MLQDHISDEHKCEGSVVLGQAEKRLEKSQKIHMERNGTMAFPRISQESMTFIA